MTGITGKRRRRTEKNSNPFMFGIRKSEMMMSGKDRFRAASPSKPSSAQGTPTVLGLRKRDAYLTEGRVVIDEENTVRERSLRQTRLLNHSIKKDEGDLDQISWSSSYQIGLVRHAEC